MGGAENRLEYIYNSDGLAQVDVRVNYGGELETLIRTTLREGTAAQLRDLLIAEVSSFYSLVLYVVFIHFYC
jgi:hypothetical protein